METEDIIENCTFLLLLFGIISSCLLWAAIDAVAIGPIFLGIICYVICQVTMLALYDIEFGSDQDGNKLWKSWKIIPALMFATPAVIAIAINELFCGGRFQRRINLVLERCHELQHMTQKERQLRYSLREHKRCRLRLIRKADKLKQGLPIVYHPPEALEPYSLQLARQKSERYEEEIVLLDKAIFELEGQIRECESERIVLALTNDPVLVEAWRLRANPDTLGLPRAGDDQAEKNGG